MQSVNDPRINTFGDLKRDLHVTVPIGNVTNEQAMANLKVIGHIRVSTSEQVDGLNSTI